MLDTVKTKTFVKLTEDHSEEGCFLPAGTEGVIIDEHTISMLSNLSEEEYSKIVRLEIAAKGVASYLVFTYGRLVTISVSNLEIVRYDPPGPLFEDDEDRNQYFDIFFGELRKNLSEGNKIASST